MNDIVSFFSQQQGNTYSSYKSRNTAKVFVATSPAGFALFISDPHEGSISDKQITQDCGFLDHIEAGDVVLADRGFTIEEDLAKKNARLIIPAFLKNCDALEAEDEIKTRMIAKARIHIERWNQRMKTYLFVKGPVPQQKLYLLTPAVYVCGILANFSELLVK